ncbi:MAG: glycoside hydrolase [Aliifodinibius sp.]|nr:glycoside hydrolase [Fodinibius sp.]NIV11208.1 glycoside hydrolase [Fodinibius sp.]NIY24800.1 glycoside hydrolase [Fodinibius sp.]
MRKLFIIIVLPLLLTSLFSQEWNRLLDLRGANWKFEIGDNPQWATPEFDDQEWAMIFVPSNWEDEGFPGYDGYAWYRKHFRFNLKKPETTIYLHLGKIDDVDEVYLNGHVIGFTGEFPPGYRTAYNIYRTYPVPAEYLNHSGANVLAIRVYDIQMEGGIVDGQVGLFELTDDPNFLINLAGIWKFRTGDDLEWSEPGYEEEQWHPINVPANWEYQGFRDYDGFAWYRKTFHFHQKQIPQEELVLMLGKIDDLDEVYLNGQLIGKTGELNRSQPEVDGDEWQELRAYIFPSKILNHSGKNVIAVRIYDGLYDGGIYQGPIGIMSSEHFARWKNLTDKGNNLDDKLLQLLDILFGK